MRRSHPHPKSSLHEHCVAVSRYMRDILRSNLSERFSSEGDFIALIAGCLHDLLKDTQAFSKHLEGAPKRDESRHSGGSAYAAYLTARHVLQQNPDILGDSSIRHSLPAIVFNVVAAHHSGLRRINIKREHSKAIQHWLDTKSDVSRKLYTHIAKSLELSTSAKNMESCIIESIADPYILDCDFKDTKADELFTIYCLTRLALGALGRADVFSARNQEIGLPELLNFPLNPSALTFVDPSDAFHDRTGLNGLRCSFQEWITNQWIADSNLVLMKAPTGLGKTVAVIRLCMKYLTEYPDARIFYLAPTVAILNQVYAEFEKYMRSGDSILLHYLSSQYETDEPEYHGPDYEKYKQERERRIRDMDAGLVITTYHRAVRLLSGLSKSDCLNLYNLENSLWILDECQFLSHYQVTVASSVFETMGELCGAQFIFMSATPPPENYFSASFEALKWVKSPVVHSLLNEKQQTEIESSVFVDGRRLVYPLPDIKLLKELAAHIDQYREKYPEKSILVLLNLARDAGALENLLSGDADYVITTYLRPLDVRKQLQQAGSDLRNNRPVLMIATSIVQAGVDLDFDAGFVELNDLRDFRQGCGRIGRNYDQNRKSCSVFAFELWDNRSRKRPSWYRQRFIRICSTENIDSVVKDAAEINVEIVSSSIATVLKHASPLTDLDIERIEQDASGTVRQLCDGVRKRMERGFPPSYANILHTNDYIQGFCFKDIQDFFKDGLDSESVSPCLAVFTATEDEIRSEITEQLTLYGTLTKQWLYSSCSVEKQRLFSNLKVKKKQLFQSLSPYLIRRHDVQREFLRSGSGKILYEDFDCYMVINSSAYSETRGWKLFPDNDHVPAESEGAVW